MKLSTALRRAAILAAAGECWYDGTRECDEAVSFELQHHADGMCPGCNGADPAETAGRLIRLAEIAEGEGR